MGSGCKQKKPPDFHGENPAAGMTVGAHNASPCSRISPDMKGKPPPQPCCLFPDAGRGHVPGGADDWGKGEKGHGWQKGLR
jgi:hypothetical protein